MNAQQHQQMEQLPWDGVFSDSALAVFHDRSLPRDLGLSGLFPESRGSDSPGIEPIYTTDFSVDHASSFVHHLPHHPHHPHHHHQFAFSDTRSTYLTPPPNMAGGSPGLMPPPPLPFKVHKHRHHALHAQHGQHAHHQNQPQQRRRRRSSGLESCDSNLERPLSSCSSSVAATSPLYQHQQQQQQHQQSSSVAGSPGSSYQSRQYPSPRSPDGHPTHQSPEEFQCAVQRQDSSTSEASDTLFKDWMHVNYEPSTLPSTFSDEDDEDGHHSGEGEDEGSHGGSMDSPAISDHSVDTVRASRGRFQGTGEFLQWGSDINFGTVKQHYTPSPLKESVESMHEFQLMTLKCLQVAQNDDLGSAWSEEVSEPPKLRTNPTANHKVMLRTLPTPMRANDKKDVDQDRDDDAEDATRGIRYKRRRIQDNSRSKSQKEEPCAGTNSAATDKEMGETTEETPKPPATRRRRRRNRETKNWPTRPVLTDEQRRQNHIQSEKKRRILINEGFDDLCALVPSLGKGKFCKSTVLQLAGQWLETLLEGNDVLEKQLATLKGAS